MHGDVQPAAVRASAQWIVAHLAFDATRVAASATGSDAAFKDLMQYLLMKDWKVLRGE